MSQERWAVIDCAKAPNSNCKLKMVVPEDRLEDLVEAACDHMCKRHNQEDNQETREMARGFIEIKEW